MNRFAAAQTLKNLARDIGFDLVAIAPVEPSRHADAYRQWIAEGKHGQMDYLARSLDERFDLHKKFPWAKSILVVALAYHQPAPPAPQDASLKTHDTGKIARYAWGRDYHKIIEAKLRRLEKATRDAFAAPPSHLAGDELQIRTYCDTGPLLEREIAARAGLGWIGKNTLLLHPQHGSYFVLGEMILSLDLRHDLPMGSHCGTCTRCIDACPTAAITPFSVDATKCISYLTLEHRGPIDEAWHAAMHSANYLIGCDICQEVCPFNRHPMPATDPDLAAKPPAPSIPLLEILAWEEQQWDILTRGRAHRRAKFPMWQRNARILRGESDQT